MEKKTVKLLRPHLRATVNRTEQWLSEKAREGWRLTDYYGWKFVFRKCTPYETQYLFYSGFNANKGLSFDYLTTKKEYKKGNSGLNKRNLPVFETDSSKVDEAYFRFKRMRNTFYMRHYALLSVFSFVTLICLFAAALFSSLQPIL